MVRDEGSRIKVTSWRRKTGSRSAQYAEPASLLRGHGSSEVREWGPRVQATIQTIDDCTITPSLVLSGAKPFVSMDGGQLLSWKPTVCAPTALCSRKERRVGRFPESAIRQLEFVTMPSCTCTDYRTARVPAGRKRATVAIAGSAVAGDMTKPDADQARASPGARNYGKKLELHSFDAPAPSTLLPRFLRRFASP